jgi:hypothetical protein
LELEIETTETETETKTEATDDLDLEIEENATEATVTETTDEVSVKALKIDDSSSASDDISGFYAKRYDGPVCWCRRKREGGERKGGAVPL